MKKIGVADTTFARIDLGGVAARTIKESEPRVAIERVTVPGMKDLPAAAKKLFAERGCDLVIALGMPGKAVIDKQCAHEASLGLIFLQVLEGKHILEVFVHEDEGKDEKELYEIGVERARKHAINAVNLLFHPEILGKNAGNGLRQGKPDVGPLKI